MKTLRATFIVFGLALLSGCEEWGSKVMTDISNKHDGSLINPRQPATAPIKQNCNQWCHNGWCSTHCEPIETFE